MRDTDQHDHDLGLAHDLLRLQLQQAQRRQALRWLAGAGALALVGCGGGGSAGTAADAGAAALPGLPADVANLTAVQGTAATSTPAASVAAESATGSNGSCSVIPEETAGPYPGDGSNGANALALSGIVRGDIRASLGGASGVAGGVALTVKLRLVSTRSSCADLSGYAIYLWHCDREGRYSMYSQGVTAESYLRGVQETGSDGTVSFTSIFPGCYSGRMPHIHFEIYRSANTASSYTNKLKTSQLAFPADVCSTVYANASGYSASVANLAAISFAKDNVFSDGVTTQLATVSGSVSQGYVATLTVGVAL